MPLRMRIIGCIGYTVLIAFILYILFIIGLQVWGVYGKAHLGGGPFD